MAKRPLPKNNTKDVLMVNQLTVKSSVQFPQLQAAVATATGGSNGGNGKNGKNGKDDTLTKDEFNSGFQDGVGQIKDGFSSLGAGLGPLQVIVDFVKGFVGKIGNIFTIFKGFFNILMSIPKAIANAFKKKDKSDDAKEGKKGKLKKALEKDRKKEKDKDRKASGKGRAGFARFATMLKPALILGAVLAISAGLIMLYNWLVGKGLFKYFEKLSTDIRVGLLNMRITLAEIFGKDKKAAELETEKADLILRKRVLNNLSQEDRDVLDAIPTEAGKAKYISTLAEEKGADMVATKDLLSDSAGQSKNLQEGLDKVGVKPVAKIDQGEYDVKINESTLDFVKDLKMSDLTKDLNLGSTFRTGGKYEHIETHVFGESVYGRTTIDLDGKPMTVGDLARLIQEAGGVNSETGEPNVSDADALGRATEMIASAPGVVIGKDSELILDRMSDHSIGMKGYQLAEETEDGTLIRDATGQSSLKDLASGDYVTFDDRGIAKEERGVFSKIFSLDAIPFVREYRRQNAMARNKELASEESMDALAQNFGIVESEIEEDLVTSVDNANELAIRTLMESASEDGELTEEQIKFLELLEMYQGVGGKTDEFSYYALPFDGRVMRPDEFYNKRQTINQKTGNLVTTYDQLSDEEITEMFIVQAMENMDIDREAATTIVNSYIDNNESMTQYVTPQNDNGQNTGSGNQTVDVTQ